MITVTTTAAIEVAICMTVRVIMEDRLMGVIRGVTMAATVALLMEGSSKAAAGSKQTLVHAAAAIMARDLLMAIPWAATATGIIAATTAAAMVSNMG